MHNLVINDDYAHGDALTLQTAVNQTIPYRLKLGNAVLPATIGSWLSGRCSVPVIARLCQFSKVGSTRGTSGSNAGLGLSGKMAACGIAPKVSCMSDFRAQIQHYIREQALPIDKYSHQPRLYQLISMIGQGLSYDDDVVYAAAWLHDLGVFIGHRPTDPDALAAWDNVAYALEKVPALLQQWQFPPEKIEVVLTAISQHSPQQTPTSIEATLLRDADMLEQLGAVAILRIVSKVGRDTRYPTFGQALATLEHNLEHLPSQLRLANSQQLAQARIAVLGQFITAAQAESQGQPW